MHKSEVEAVYKLLLSGRGRKIAKKGARGQKYHQIPILYTPTLVTKIEWLFLTNKEHIFIISTKVVTGDPNNKHIV